MEPAATALMVLLSCSPDAADCREMRGAETYSTISVCRERLPSVLERLNEADRTVIGRCALAADVVPPVDRMVTSSVPSPQTDGLGSTDVATVFVTKLGSSSPVTEAYAVQRSP